MGIGVEEVAHTFTINIDAQQERMLREGGVNHGESDQKTTILGSLSSFEGQRSCTPQRDRVRR